MSAAQASVIRDGERAALPAAELVPGDIILIEEGDTIPADARLIQSTALQTAEAALTGESLPVIERHRANCRKKSDSATAHNMVFSGTAATYGRGRAVVVATGMQTEMGRIAGMLRRSAAGGDAAAKGARPHVGKLLGRHRRRHRRRHDRDDHPGRACAAVLRRIFDVLILGVALAVAAVPEGLPAVVTAVLSLGVQRMARSATRSCGILPRSKRWAPPTSLPRTRPARSPGTR